MSAGESITEHKLNRSATIHGRCLSAYSPRELNDGEARVESTRCCYTVEFTLPLIDEVCFPSHEEARKQANRGTQLIERP